MLRTVNTMCASCRHWDSYVVSDRAVNALAKRLGGTIVRRDEQEIDVVYVCWICTAQALVGDSSPAPNGEEFQDGLLDALAK